MKQYASYKDIDIWWINKIPASWKIIKSHYLFFPVSRKGYPDAELLSVYRDFGVIPRYSRDDNYNRPSDDLSNYKFVEKGDLVFNKMKTWQGSLGISDYAGIVSPAYIVCKPRQQIYGKYFHHLYRSKGYIKELARLSYGIRPNQWDLRYEDFAEIPALIPPLNEQKTIANYLGHKTDQIDTLIEKKQKQIELLKEQRTAIINHVVTKGLNPNVKIKDSGIEWLGDIPEHWLVLPIKWMVKTPVTDGPHETPDFLDDGVPFISAEAIKNDQIDFSKKRGFISQEDHEKFSKKYIPKKGDIYMVKSGATTGNVAVVETDEEFNIWSPLAVIRPDFKKAITSFVFYFMKSKSFFQAIELGWSYGTQQNIGMGVIENISIVLPPIPEQESIASFLNRTISKIDHTISGTEREIDLIKEYRTTLISDAVTGKIDVRDEVPT